MKQMWYWIWDAASWVQAPCKGHPCLPCPLGFEKWLFRPLVPAVLAHGGSATWLLLVSATKML